MKATEFENKNNNKKTWNCGTCLSSCTWKLEAEDLKLKLKPVLKPSSLIT